MLVTLSGLSFLYYNNHIIAMARPEKKDYPTTIQVRMPDELVRAIDDYRRNLPDLPTRSEAIRRALATFLLKAKK